MAVSVAVGCKVGVGVGGKVCVAVGLKVAVRLGAVVAEGIKVTGIVTVKGDTAVCVTWAARRAAIIALRSGRRRAI